MTLSPFRTLTTEAVADGWSAASPTCVATFAASSPNACHVASSSGVGGLSLSSLKSRSMYFICVLAFSQRIGPVSVAHYRRTARPEMDGRPSVGRKEGGWPLAPLLIGSSRRRRRTEFGRPTLPMPGRSRLPVLPV